MTRKTPAKAQRTRTTTKAKSRTSAKSIAGDDVVMPRLDIWCVRNRLASGPVRPKPAQQVVQDAHDSDPPVSWAPVVTKTRPSARCAIVATAFRAATSGAIRRQLKGRSAPALVVLVPGPSWIQPVRKLFVSYFGEQWQAVATEALRTPQQKAERNGEVAADLARGRPVIGVAVERDALPTALTTAADLTIRINAPTGATIGRAIRMFTGQRVPSGLDDGIAAGLEFHDLVAAFRTNSSPADIIARLRKAAAAVRGAGTTERLPALEQAIEYGDARTWGMALARDIADYRAGRLDWQDVDRGAVLFSEPGLGKSLFARILAQACGVPLVAFSIADLFANSSGYLDSVIKASRAMFERAAALAPCILFLDEIDALPNRATMSPRGADWWTPVVTDFLLSLDNAVAGKRAGIVVIGATNNIQGVDAAVLRPGRLERAIEIRRPDHAGAANILRHHLDGELSQVDLTDVAHLMDGSTGAEIMMAVRGARRIARYAGRALQLEDLVQAVAPVEDIAPSALKRICIHEAAHAVASLVVPSGVLKRCTVGGSGGSAGRTLLQWETDDLMTRDSIERRAIVMLAGRTAERILIGDATLGCGGDDESDLAQVTQVIATLHASTGLGDTLAYVASYQEALNAVRGDREIRSKVEQHLQILQARTEEIVRRHRDAIVAVADRLRTRRRLSGEEIRRIVDATPASCADATAPDRFGVWWQKLRRRS
jgi:cell division protease FtsH